MAAVKVEIDLSKRAGEISPLLFGHNLEHTRSCVWRGLAAQLVRNRKFAGLPEKAGVAAGWYGIGPESSFCLVESTSGRKDTRGEPFTMHFGDAEVACAARHRQRIQSFGRGGPCGIGQRGVFLMEGREYGGRAALLSDRKLSVRILVRGADGSQVCESVVAVKPGEWTEHEFTFVSTAADDDSRIEIVFDEAGVLYVGAVSLLPADCFHGMRRDVVELLREISVPILRWPGGNFAGSYRWMDGLMPPDRRPPLWSGLETLPHTGGYDDHEIGTDEFLALCEELRAEPFITINVSFEGPEEARAWVEYCNGSAETKWGKLRAERGHTEPYGVRHWSLGNEMGYGHMAGPNAPEAYGKTASACAEAMREVDPSITLVASGAWWKDEWYERVLADFGDCFEIIAYHEYIDLVKDFEGEKGARELRRVATAPDETLRTLRGVRERTDACAPGGKAVGISFDEWNVWYAWYRTPGVAEGVHAASMLNMFCREARKLGMPICAYFEPVNEGAILVGPGSSRLTPAGQAFRLFRPHHGNELIALAPQAEGADLDVAASVNEAEKQAIITLVNRSPARGGEVKFHVKNASGTLAAKGSVLTSSDFLPGSTFVQKELDVAVQKDQTFTVSVPKHSVARIQLGYG